MRRFSRAKRLTFGLLAIVQMAAPTLAVAADATNAGSANRIAGRAHVEDQTHAPCEPQHLEDCALCQFLSHLAPGKTAPSDVPLAAKAVMAPCLDRARGSALSSRATERTRAPPVAV